MVDAPEPFHPVTEGLDVRLRVTPKASRDAIGEVVADGQGKGAIKIAVTAVPEKGSANAAVIKLLAKAWRLRKSDMEIVQGATDRNKTLRIAGDGMELMARLRPLLRHSR
ncbi:MAG: DUF167 domain-containing protein [Rhodospirillales bacterium]|nr:DUF167 domain-containing protein [Rhodospirillales bacterium]MBO6787800.1 DUF167 domain-containing protein [Rhodospirillales bacterium]